MSIDPPSGKLRSIRVFHPGLPPSENRIRGHRAGGHGEFYTKEAQGFRSDFLRHVGGTYKIPLQRFVQGHTVYSIYRLVVLYHLERDAILTKSWGKKGGAASPYKHSDTANRLKLLADCLVQVMGGGLDDCLYFEVSQAKLLAEPGKSGVTLTLEEALPEEFGISRAELA